MFFYKMFYIYDEQLWYQYSTAFHANIVKSLPISLPSSLIAITVGTLLTSPTNELVGFLLRSFFQPIQGFQKVHKYTRQALPRECLGLHSNPYL